MKGMDFDVEHGRDGFAQKVPKAKRVQSTAVFTVGKPHYVAVNEDGEPVLTTTPPEPDPDATPGQAYVVRQIDESTITLSTSDTPCDSCGGKGKWVVFAFAEGIQVFDCPKCGGTGRVPQSM